MKPTNTGQNFPHFSQTQQKLYVIPLVAMFLRCSVSHCQITCPGVALGL